MINFILWNGSPVLFSVGPVTVRWYALLFIIAFIAARQVFIGLRKKSGKGSAGIESILIYLVFAAVIAARITYVLSYDAGLIVSKTLEALLPVELKPSFHFSGLAGMSGHGAVLGALIVLWFFRRRLYAQRFMELLDRFCIALALTAMIFALSYFINGDLRGSVTNMAWGVINIRPVTEGLVKIPCCIMRNPGGANPLQKVTVRKDASRKFRADGHSPIIFYLFFKPGSTEQSTNEFLIGDVKTFLFDNSGIVHEPGDEPLHYTNFLEAGVFTSRIRAIGIARHPISLYESTVFGLMLVLSSRYWVKAGPTIPAGRLAGMFFFIGWIMMFMIGFFTEPIAHYEVGMALKMSQILSIPFIAGGAYLIRRSFQKG